VPIKTPAHIIDTIGREAEKAMTSSDVMELLARQGLEASYKNSRDFKTHIARETAMWAKVIRDANIKAEQ
jgi:tripartite-type tricarboxylate transporter receptor subunit TctC